MDGREDVVRFLGATPSPVQSIEEARTQIARWNAGSEPGRGLWAIERVAAQPGDRLLGTVLLQSLERSDGRPSHVVEIGWHLHPQWYGVELMEFRLDL